MKKKNLLVPLTLAGLLVMAGIVSAHSGFGQEFGAKRTHHEEMEEVMEEGNYKDLVKLRVEIGFNIMPWVDSEGEFKEMQERHEAMEKFHEENGYRMIGFGFRRMGCHNW